MKKRRLIPALCAVLMLISACSGTDAPSDTNGDRAPDDVNPAITGTFGIDYDLTKLSDLLAYSQAAAIAEAPYNYVGKTMKMRGKYSSSVYPESGELFHFIEVGDDSSCCWQRFTLRGDGFPEDGAKVEVTGTYERFETQGRSYYRLAVSKLTVLS